MICSGCRRVKYCTVEHQKLAWREHKKVCGALRKPKGGWRVTIKLMMSPDVRIEELACQGTTTVRELTERFAARVGVPSGALTLLYGHGALIDKDATLASIGVVNGNYFGAMVSMRGCEGSISDRAPDRGSKPLAGTVGLFLKNEPRQKFIGRKVLRTKIGVYNMFPTATTIYLETPDYMYGPSPIGTYDDDSISDAPGPTENYPDFDNGGGFRFVRLDHGASSVVKALDDVILNDLVGLKLLAIEWREFDDGRPVPAGASVTPQEHRDTVKTTCVLIFPGFELWSVKESSTISSPADLMYLISNGDDGGAIEANLPADAWDA